MNNLNPWPYYSEETIEAVTAILKSSKVNYLNGSEGKLFEKEFSSYTGIDFSIALSNGTTALTCAYLALDLKEGDEIITTPRTFIATSSAAVLLGLKPVFADVDLNSGCIDPEQIEPLITKKTKAISIVHIAGWPADMEKIKKIANKHNLYMIEDCSQAHGARINGLSVGNFSDIATWSFCQDKIISTGGEGGMITTSNKTIRDRVWSYKDHGKSIRKLKKPQPKNEFKYIHDSFGTNYRITEMQSAIGRIQLKNLELMRNKREQNAMLLASYLKEIKSVRIPIPKKGIVHAWYKFYFYLDKNLLKSNWNRSKIIEEINLSGFKALSGSCSEIYKEKCFQDLNLSPREDLKNAKLLGESSIALLVHPTINEKQINSYAEVVRDILIKATIN